MIKYVSVFHPLAEINSLDALVTYIRTAANESPYVFLLTDAFYQTSQPFIPLRYGTDPARSFVVRGDLGIFDESPRIYFYSDNYGLIIDTSNQHYDNLKFINMGISDAYYVIKMNQQSFLSNCVIDTNVGYGTNAILVTGVVESGTRTRTGGYEASRKPHIQNCCIKGKVKIGLDPADMNLDVNIGMFENIVRKFRIDFRSFKNFYYKPVIEINVDGSPEQGIIFEEDVFLFDSENELNTFFIDNVVGGSKNVYFYRCSYGYFSGNDVVWKTDISTYPIGAVNKDPRPEFPFWFVNESFKRIEDKLNILTPGEGQLTHTIQLYELNTTNPITQADVELYDASNAIRLRSGRSGTDGRVIFSGIISGTYKVRISKLGVYNFNLETIILSQDNQTTIVYGSPISLPSPSQPSLCVIYGNVRDIDAVARSDAELYYWAVGKYSSGVVDMKTPIIIDDSVYTVNKKKVLTASGGLFSFEVVRNAVIAINIKESQVTKKYIVPDVAVVHIKDLQEVF